MSHDLTFDIFWWLINIYWSLDDFIKTISFFQWKIFSTRFYWMRVTFFQWWPKLLQRIFKKKLMMSKHLTCNHRKELGKNIDCNCIFIYIILMSYICILLCNSDSISICAWKILYRWPRIHSFLCQRSFYFF